MASKAVRYFTSKKFRKDMAKVGADAIPFGNSTPLPVIKQRIAETRKTSDKQS
jgi:hypothetical protein